MKEFEYFKHLPCCRSKNFTKEFFDGFLRDYKAASADDSRLYENTRKSAFYNLDSCDYCLFLEEFEATAPKYNIRFTEGAPYYNQVKAITRISFPDAETAAKWAESHKELYGAAYSSVEPA